jgi:hypothetical protein
VLADRRITNWSRSLHYLNSVPAENAVSAAQSGPLGAAVGLDRTDNGVEESAVPIGFDVAGSSVGSAGGYC